MDGMEIDALQMRAAVLDAMIIAVERRHRLFDVIESAQSVDEARTAVMRAFDFSEVQAHAVLDLQVRRFVGESGQVLHDERAHVRRMLE